MEIQIPHSTFTRDTNSMALINHDTNGLNEYMKKRKLMENQKQEINNIKSDVAGLKDDLGEIKQLLSKLLEKGSNGC